MKKPKKFKRCPRCDKKADIFAEKCEDCGLIYARLDKATNRAAKKAIKRKEYNKVIKDVVLPKDMVKWKLVLVAIFTGWIGGHYFYVGRNRMGTLCAVGFFSLLISVLLPMSWFSEYYLSALMWGLIFAGTFTFFCWIIGIFAILLNKFKIPISIDEEYVIESLDKDIVKDILDSTKSLKEAENLPNQKIKVNCPNCKKKVKIYKDKNICPNCNKPINDELVVSDDKEEK